MAALLLPSLQALQFQYIILILYHLDDYNTYQGLSMNMPNYEVIEMATSKPPPPPPEKLIQLLCPYD
jgi:hypothetical protein